MDVISQAAGKDFNFFKAQVRELDVERNLNTLTSLFRTITGTKHNTRRGQVTGIPPMPIILDVASPTIIPSVATALGTPVTIMSPAQEALATTTVSDTPAMVEQEL